MKGNVMGMLAFFVGLFLAALIAVLGSVTAFAPWYLVLLALLGLVVGLLNIKDKEVVPFMIAGIAFIMSFGALAQVVTQLLKWGAIGTFFNLLQVFIAPAIAVVALKAIYNIAKN